MSMCCDGQCAVMLECLVSILMLAQAQQGIHNKSKGTRIDCAGCVCHHQGIKLHCRQPTSQDQFREKCGVHAS